jgi:hypothetical protein
VRGSAWAFHAYLYPHSGVGTGCFENQGREVDLQELLKLLFIVGNAQNAEIDLLDEGKLSLLSRWARHGGGDSGGALGLCGLRHEA